MVFRLSCALLFVALAFWWLLGRSDSAQVESSQEIIVAVPEVQMHEGDSNLAEQGSSELDFSTESPTPVFVDDNPDRTPQSLGDDIDFDDITVFDDAAAQSIGEDIDVEDLTIFSDATVVDVGEDLDVEDFDLIEVRSPQNIGEDLNIEDFYGIAADVPEESVGDDVDPD